MSRFGLFICVSLLSAQSVTKTVVTVARVSAPRYPKLALQARIATTVVLNITVRPDGSVDSVALVSGHPLLNDAAIESAKNTLFDCKECREPVIIQQVTYRFELGDALPCEGINSSGYGIYDENADTQVSQSSKTIIVLGHPYGACDPRGRISFLRLRSAKCLYLWRCGKRQPTSGQ